MCYETERAIKEERDRFRSQLADCQKVQTLMQARIDALEHIVRVCTKRNPALIRVLCREPYIITNNELGLLNQHDIGYPHFPEH